jgi:hypothetical protein
VAALGRLKSRETAEGSTPLSEAADIVSGRSFSSIALPRHRYRLGAVAAASKTKGFEVISGRAINWCYRGRRPPAASPTRASPMMRFAIVRSAIPKRAIPGRLRLAREN